MMARSVIIGVRVPEAVKQEWEAQASQDGRTLSNWIKHQMKLVVPSSQRPRQGKKVLAG